MAEITRILEAIDQGDARAAKELLPLVYDELRRLATRKLSHEKPGQTLQATALVHEAYIRLVGSEDPQWDNRGHFFAAAAEAMQRILVDSARRKRRDRHGGDRVRVDLHEADLATDQSPEVVLALEEALTKLATEDPKLAELVRLRFFAGITMEQAARVQGISLRTAQRHWQYARAWLHSEVHRQDTTISESRDA
jgi:RNA polymerase sigma factor (TIGR02999 family)